MFFDLIANNIPLMTYGTTSSECIAAIAQELECVDRARMARCREPKPLRIVEKIGLIC